MATKKQAQKRKGSSAAASKKKENQATNRYAVSVILFAVAILMFCIAIFKGEIAWTFLHNVWLGLCGFSAYVWPFVMIYSAVLLAMDKDRSYCTRHIVCASLLLYTVQVLVDVFMHGDDKLSYIKYIVKIYQSGAKGGGFLGAVLGDGLCALLGTTGAKIVIILVTFVMLMLLTGTTLTTLFSTVSKPAKKLKETVETAYDKHNAERKAVDVEINVSNRHPYDVAIEGEDPINPAGTPEPVNIKAQGRKLINAFKGSSVAEIVPDIEVDDNIDSEADAPSIDNIIDGLNSNIEVVSDDKPSRTHRKKKVAVDVDGDGTVDFTADAPDDNEKRAYQFPLIDLLSTAPTDSVEDIRKELTLNSDKLVDTLRSFGVETRVINISRGPSITRYELQPAAGVRISRIANLTDDIALSLATTGVRIEAPIPNKAAVGIEVPNKARSSVYLRDLIESSNFKNAKSKLTAVLGRDITGEECYMDIAKMPHILIAGTTGSGKSVCLNSMIISILYNAHPDDVKMLMIDPKAVEMKVYNGIEHLLVPVVTDPKKAAGTLCWAVNEMERRYQLLSEHNVRNIAGFNELAEHDETLKKLPQMVIFIDEFADLMMTAPSEVEESVCRLAQKARAAGIHLVIATQSPRADVITGLIKSNVPSRISLKVASPLESRIILDMQGAERLIGNGDMLYSPTGSTKPVRIQGCWISDAEIQAVTNFLKKESAGTYDNEIMEEIERQASLAKQNKKSAAEQEEDVEDDDPLLTRALECVVDMGQASTSMLQRKLKLGYARAARIMDQLEAHNYIGPAEGAKPRQVFITRDQLTEMQAFGEVDLH